MTITFMGEEKGAYNCILSLLLLRVKIMNVFLPSLPWFYKVKMFRLFFLTYVLPLTFICQQL